MNISPITLRPELADVRAGSKSATEEKKLAEATRQFEAMLLRQILQQARQTVIKSKFTESSAGSEIYQDLVNAQMADAMTQSGGFGLARTLERQLSPHTSSAHPKATIPTSKPPASHD
jgi:flagellar protein FlgJ